MVRFWTALLIVSLVFLSHPARAQGAAIGEVTRIRGDAAAIQGSERRTLRLGAQVFERDDLVTGGATRLEVRLADGSVLTLGDRTRVTIADFRYRASDGFGRQLFSVVAGVFRAVSGQIAKLRRGTMVVVTPTATIGIRGTDFWGEQRADLLKLALIEGTVVSVENAAGRIVLTRPRTITVVTSPTVAPTRPRRLSDAELAAAVATVAF